MLQDPDMKWADGMEEAGQKGARLVTKAADEALEYVATVVDSIEDKEYRRIAVEGRALEIGVGRALVEQVAPVLNDMDKTMHKKLKGLGGSREKDKMVANVLANIYIGRVIENIVKEVNNHADK